ncbi:MAG: hypothetical protein RL536_362, partial [Candidatus Parcubacteria bacterium]
MDFSASSTFGSSTLSLTKYVVGDWGFIIISFVAFFILVSFLGRGLAVSFIFSFYISLLLFALFPFLDSLIFLE